MSKVCRILALSSDQVVMLQGKPMLASDLARVSEYNETDPTVRRAMARLPMAERIAFAARRQPEEALIAIARRRVSSLGPVESALNLGTSWHMLHYIFTGRARAATRNPWHHFLTRRSLPIYDPADSLMNGEPLGENLGHGPPRLQDEARTASFARFLDAQDAEQLKERVHFRKMTWLGIHGLPFGPRENADFANELRTEVGVYFSLLREHVARAHAQNGGLLIWLS